MDYNTIILEVAKLLTGIITGTLFATWYKNVKDIKADKRMVFRRLLIAKGYMKIPQFIIDDLNTVEVIFRGNNNVISRYRDYYAELATPPEAADYQKQKALLWDLLRAMGNVVGYRNLDNKTLNASYIPNHAVESYTSTKEFESELVRYLRSGSEFHEFLLWRNQQKPPSGNTPANPPDPPQV